jgi:hypothetical protein
MDRSGAQAKVAIKTGRVNFMKRIISLGAGVQSSAMLLMSLLGALDRADCAIFADTQAEPRAVYDYLEYLKIHARKFRFSIYEVTRGNILEDKWCKIPAFTDTNGRAGIIRRQCTSDYKINVINKKARELVGLKPRQKTKTPLVETWLGISTDEAGRMRDSSEKWKTNRYPLIEKRMSRTDCLRWLEENGFRRPPKSSCFIYPFHSDFYWRELYKNSPVEFEKACRFDERIRDSTKAKLERPVYLHRSLRPLRELPFLGDVNQLELFGNEC